MKFILNKHYFRLIGEEFKDNELKSSTIERYDIIYRNYIKNSSIASIKLKDLKATTIQIYYNMLNEEGKSAYSIKMLHKVLKSCLEYAKK
ncbi:hypothetical protein FDB79_01760 [Clostridium botulinum]|nr:hypothetical protein [Clostridium botulinum]